MAEVHHQDHQRQADIPEEVVADAGTADGRLPADDGAVGGAEFRLQQQGDQAKPGEQ